MNPICPIHRCRMRGHKEATPNFVRTWNNAPATRTVYRCPIPNCPRIECAYRSFFGSPRMRQYNDAYLSKTWKGFQ